MIATARPEIAVSAVGEPTPASQRAEVVMGSLAPLLPLVAIAALMHYLWRTRRRDAALAPPPCDGGLPPPEVDIHQPPMPPESDSLGVLPLRYCPVCNSAYLPGTEECEECGIELQNEPEDPLSSPPVGRDSTIRIARIPDPIRCSLVTALLHNQGIPCVVSRASVLGNLGGDIYVFVGDAFHARRLIREYLADLEKEPLKR
jgi:hypothetical protein